MSLRDAKAGNMSAQTRLLDESPKAHRSCESGGDYGYCGDGYAGVLDAFARSGICSDDAESNISEMTSLTH